MKSIISVILSLGLVFISVEAFALDLDQTFKTTSSTLNNLGASAMGAAGGIKQQISGGVSTAVKGYTTAVGIGGAMKNAGIGYMQKQITNAPATAMGIYNSINSFKPGAVSAAVIDDNSTVIKELSSVNSTVLKDNSTKTLNTEGLTISTNNKENHRLNLRHSNLNNHETSDSKEILIPTKEILTPGEIRGMKTRNETQKGSSNVFKIENLTPVQKKDFEFVKNNPFKYEANQTAPATLTVKKPFVSAASSADIINNAAVVNKAAVIDNSTPVEAKSAGIALLPNSTPKVNATATMKTNGTVYEQMKTGTIVKPLNLTGFGGFNKYKEIKNK